MWRRCMPYGESWEAVSWFHRRVHYARVRCDFQLAYGDTMREFLRTANPAKEYRFRTATNEINVSPLLLQGSSLTTNTRYHVGRAVAIRYFVYGRIRPRIR